MPSKYSNKKEYLDISITCLMPEFKLGYLKSKSYLHGAICRNCKREVMNNKIQDEEKTTKILFNRKNTFLTCKYYWTIKDVIYNFCICVESIHALSIKEITKETRNNDASKVTRKSTRGSSNTKK